MNIKTLAFFTGMVCLFFASGVLLVYGQDAALARHNWKQEYAEVCAKTQNAMALSAVELQGFIDRCDVLRESLDGLDGPQEESERKVYSKRLEMCRDLFIFALEYKEKKE